MLMPRKELFVLEDSAAYFDFIASRSNRPSQCLASSDERTKRTALVHGRRLRGGRAKSAGIASS